MSMKLADSLRMKYSLAMLRPPVDGEAMLSATNSLLCMRRFTRSNSCSDSSRRVRSAPPRTGSGLNSRTCTLSCAARPISRSSWSPTCRSSISRRTRTPRWAASRSSRRELAARLIGRHHVVLHVERLLRVAAPTRCVRPALQGRWASGAAQRGAASRPGVDDTASCASGVAATSAIASERVRCTSPGSAAQPDSRLHEANASAPEPAAWLPMRMR